MLLYKYMSEAGLMRFLKTLTLRFSPALAFNDPFEIRPTIGTEEEHKRESKRRSKVERDGFFDYDFGWSLRHFLNTGIGVNVGILCLSEDPCQALMWAHYADCHTGAAVGFEAGHPFFAATAANDRSHQSLQFLKPVKYSKKRSVLSLEFFRKYKSVEIARSGWIELLKLQHPLFLTKSPEWKYEKEWRLVRQLMTAPETPDEWSKRIMDAKEPQKIRGEQVVSIPAKAVKSIILGYASRRQGPDDSDGLEEETIAALDSNVDLSHVELWKARLHSRDFSVVRYNLDSLRDLEAERAPPRAGNQVRRVCWPPTSQTLTAFGRTLMYYCEDGWVRAAFSGGIHNNFLWTFFLDLESGASTRGFDRWRGNFLGGDLS